MMENEGVKKNVGKQKVISWGERLEAIDGVRAVAILAIVVCHVCYGFSEKSILGQYLGGTFNYVFLLISAYLFGLKHAAKPEVWGGQFLRRRMVRLCWSLYPFLGAVVVASWAFGIPLSPIQVAQNFLFLGWCAKLPGNGHLWFITMVMLTYVEYAVLTAIRRKSLQVALLLLLLPVSLGVSLAGLPGYCFLMMAGCGLVFVFAPLVRSLLDQLGWWQVILLYAVGNAMTIPALVGGYTVIGAPSYYYMTLMTGVASFLLLHKLFGKLSLGRMGAFTSAISFELYLVHHPISDYHLFMPLVHYPTIAIVLVFVASYAAAYCLNQVARRIGEILGGRFHI